MVLKIIKRISFSSHHYIYLNIEWQNGNKLKLLDQILCSIYITIENLDAKTK